MNRLYLSPRISYQFVQHGFTVFVLEGFLEVTGELPHDLVIEEPYAALKPEECTTTLPGYKAYVEAKLLISSEGLDLKTCAMLASLESRPSEKIECEYSNHSSPLGTQKTYTIYHKVTKVFRSRI